MLGEKLLEERPVSLVEVKRILKERKTDDKEPTYEQNASTKYAKHFCKLTEKQAEKVFSELKEIEGMSDELAVKLIDIMPKHIEVLKVIIKKDNPVKEENFEKIIEICSKYSKKE